ncbi:hypothetical protein BD410DRAFT_787909 [Rickenella mellea]|uniref:Uncharacterized protein n=1 Tax=Rickenella mellea TaxID=50990 RepID=A0A4Y7Q601_9AGAM|nr:hypothetical protein BD410DRAFT_787909 [Rickenella mellea]
MCVFADEDPSVRVPKPTAVGLPRQPRDLVPTCSLITCVAQESRNNARRCTDAIFARRPPIPHYLPHSWVSNAPTCRRYACAWQYQCSVSCMRRTDVLQRSHRQNHRTRSRVFGHHRQCQGQNSGSTFCCHRGNAEVGIHHAFPYGLEPRHPEHAVRLDSGAQHTFESDSTPPYAEPIRRVQQRGKGEKSEYTFDGSISASESFSWLVQPQQPRLLYGYVSMLDSMSGEICGQS